MNSFIFVVFALILYATIIILYAINCSRPRKSIIDKYGKPIKHFTGQRSWNGLRTHRGRIDIDFYQDFVVIKENVRETVLKKDFKDYKFYCSIFNPTIEIGNLQIGISRNLKKYFEEFFDAN